MARHSASGTTAAVLADNKPICSIVPGASTNFKLLRAYFGVSTAGTTPSDFQIVVGVNRGTTRGTSTGTATINKFDPLSPTTSITAVDTTWSVDPSLAAADAQRYTANTRGSIDNYYGSGTGADDFASTTGATNPIVFVHRSGAALPASHSIVWTVEWED